MLNVAKYALLTLLALPVLELAVFIAVGAAIGFGWAVSLVLTGSIAGLLILRHVGGRHAARMRVVLSQGNFTALQADGPGSLIMVGGILLLIPGFITDIAAICLLIPPLRHVMRAAVNYAVPPVQNDGVFDLAPEQWHQVPDPSLPDRHKHEPKHDPFLAF
jgi:UPF0716 protein FxsA